MLILGCECTTQKWWNTKKFEKVRRAARSPYYFCQAPSSHYGFLRIDCSKILDRAQARFQLGVLRFGVTKVPARILLVGEDDLTNPVRRAIRVWINKDCVDHTENRRRRANPQSNGKNCDGSESGFGFKHAGAVKQILTEIVQEAGQKRHGTPPISTWTDLIRFCSRKADQAARLQLLKRVFF